MLHCRRTTHGKQGDLVIFYTFIFLFGLNLNCGAHDFDYSVEQHVTASNTGSIIILNALLVLEVGLHIIALSLLFAVTFSTNLSKGYGFGFSVPVRVRAGGGGAPLWLN